jgi:hypothetical protein
MVKVFVCSVPNLAAAASGDVHGGLYRHLDPAKLNSCDIPACWQTSQPGSPEAAFTKLPCLPA